jgi:predicted small metal-binding protein
MKAAYTFTLAIMVRHPSRLRETVTMVEKKVSCDCGKTMHATSDDELVRTVQEHARSVHSMDLSREQVLAMAEPA